MNRLEIENIFINDIDFNEIVEIYKHSIENDEHTEICYANAYSVIIGRKVNSFRAALNKVSYVHPDGVGIYLAAKILGMNFKDRFNWTDHASKFLQLCELKGWSIFFLGSEQDTITSAKKNMVKNYPLLKLVGVKNGFYDVENPKLISEINELKPNILWVGMGSPKQELWIAKNRYLLKCNIIHAVGDVISLFAGKKVRGSKLIRKIGLEWLIRLLRHPIRYFKRYVIGIPVFFYIILMKKMTDNEIS